VDKHGKEVYATVWDYNDLQFPDMKYESLTGTDKLTYIVTGADNKPTGVDLRDTTFYVTAPNWTRVPDKEGIHLDSRGEIRKPEVGDIPNADFLGYAVRRVFDKHLDPGGVVTKMFMGVTEIPYNLWKAVCDWARGSYSFTNNGHPSDITNNNSPVADISWQDAVVWCNAYSEFAKRTPVYKINGTVLQDSSDVDATTLVRDTDNADGFWLPTAEEWEYAARGGKKAAKDWGYPYAGSTDINEVAVVGNVAVVASKGPKGINRLGLYDMSGNVWELCQDMVIRGGGYDSPNECMVTSERPIGPGDKESNVGFRGAHRP
jgi:hypothetical protein